MDFLNDIQKQRYLQELEIEKSVEPNLMSIYEFQDLLKSGYELVDVEDGLTIEKAEKDVSKLIKKQIWVTRNGKSFRQTVYVKEKEPEKQVDTPIGEELSPTVKGMNITKYSDKALLITGDTKVNLETLRSIKKDINVGSWNNKLGGWVFPLKYVETVLGYIWSGLKENGEDEKADAVQNQKNAGLSDGDKAEINGTPIEVKENVSDNEGTKYNAKLDDGTELKGINEKVIDKKPETDDKKIADAVNNATPESRVSTEKKIFGIKPVKDIHNYTLAEYMGMHGLDQADIDKAIAAFTKPKGEKKRSGGGGGGTSPKKESGEQGMTKKQLIAKLIYAHYQAVQAAVKAGEQVKPEVLATYADLQQEVKDRKPMSEETKRKISEALKKNKVEVEDVKIKYKKDLEEEIERFRKTPDSEKDIFVNQLIKKTEQSKKKYEFHKEKNIDVLTELSHEDYIYHKDILLPAILIEIKSLAEAKGVKVEENPQVEKEEEEAKKQGADIPDKTNYQPKDGEIFTLEAPKNQMQREPLKIKSKDYTDIPPIDVVIPKQKNILDAPKPYFIPNIDEYKFRNNGATLSAVKVGEDRYLVALDGFMGGRGAYSASLEGVTKSGKFAVMSLDTFTATQKYYQSKAKEQLKVDAIEKNERFLQSLRDQIVKAKSEGNTARAESLETSLKHYEKKKPKAKRLTVYKDNKMSYDQMHMIQLFNRDENGNFVGRRETWEIYKDMYGIVDQKSKDLDMQQEHDESSFTKGRETSYGDSGTKDTLMKDYGVMVKRQNGDEITESEIKQIKNALDVTANLFGNNIEMNKEFGLKISHSGDVLMHAMKAVGVFFPYYNAIGVSEKYGDSQFQFTFGHEYAHFMDYWIGKKTGNHYASDKQGTTANQIASTFRKNMNKKQDSVYQNRTCECFARALEQYVATETYGSDVTKTGFGGAYKDKDNHVNEKVYNEQLKPLIKQFLEENKEFLKSTLFDIFK